jgi:cycloeucalenol cycloisomerase
MKKVLIPNDDGSTAGADADTASILASIPPVAIQMTTILVTMLAVLAGLVQMQSFGDRTTKYVMYGPKHTLYLPSPTREPSKRAYETFCLAYTPVWISAFGYIVASGVYEQFTAWSYNYVCVGLALPLLLQPLLYTYSRWCPKQEQQRPFYQRYAFKANLWIAIFSFIGNYWYTHYFYSVLHAQYTMPAHRLNNVPIALYFATHFYFSTYHVLSNIMLRTITTRYSPTYLRHALFLGAILCFAYFTAFMETLTISSFPYYSFEDRDMVRCSFVKLFLCSPVMLVWSGLVCFPRIYHIRSYIYMSSHQTNVHIIITPLLDILYCTGIYRWFGILWNLLYCVVSHVLCL